MQEVSEHKSGISRPTLKRLENRDRGMTAMRTNHHVFNDYIQNKPRKLKDYERKMWEDVEFLVKELNQRIGSSFNAIILPEPGKKSQN